MVSVVSVSTGLPLIQSSCHATRDLIDLLTLLIGENARPRTRVSLGAVWDCTIPNLSKDLPPPKCGGVHWAAQGGALGRKWLLSSPPPLKRSYLVLQNALEQRLQMVGGAL